jgi:hypothetical protein
MVTGTVLPGVRGGLQENLRLLTGFFLGGHKYLFYHLLTFYLLVKNPPSHPLNDGGGGDMAAVMSKINKTTPTSRLQARGGGGDDVAVVIA